MDGRNLTEFNVAWYRSQLGCVFQEPELFSGTIRENIRMGKLEASNDDVVEAARWANCDGRWNKV